MSWKYDAPSGVYRNHALSSDIRRESIADVQLMRFMRPEPGFGKGKGESVTITRVLALPEANRISELDRIPSGRPAIETKQVSVSQWGYKVPMTEFEKNLTFFDITNPIQAALRDQMSLTMDTMCAAALKKTPVKYTPTVSGGTFSTSGAAAGVSDRNLGVQDLRRIHDYLADDLKCPPFRNGKYVGVLSVKAARGLKNDPDYKDWIAPTSSVPLMTGQLKDIEGFALFETNHHEALSQFAGTSLTTGEALFFGADAGGLLQIQAPEIRAGVPEELGTFREVGWVGTIEAFLVWERPSLARAIHLASL